MLKSIRPSGKQVAMALGAALTASWICIALFGTIVASAIAGKIGPKLLSASEGIIADPALFLHARMIEVLWITTVMAILSITLAWLWKWITARPRLQQCKGLAMGVALFAAANVMIGVCGNTACFWLVLHDSRHVDNLVRYQIKKNLMAETGDRRRVIVVGNSQANRAIDENIINRAYPESIWVTEITQPGARGFDLLVLGRDMAAQPGDLVVFYLSEISFHGRSSGIVVADFFKFGDLLDAIDLDGLQWIEPGAVRSGLVGRSLPTYRIRQPLANRLLAWQDVRNNQNIARHEPPRNIEAMAKEMAPNLKIDDSSQFERQSFVQLVDELLATGCDIILIPGHLHPALRREMDPQVAKEFASWFHDLRKYNPSRITVLGSEHFFAPGEDDFDDLVHFNEEAQIRFTNELASAFLQLLLPHK